MRKFWRRTFALALIGGVAFIAHPAEAQFKPSRDVEFVIPFGLGGGADLLARTIIKIAADEKIVPTAMVATNRPGGGSATGVGHVVANKRGDPHTLVLVNPQTQITPLRVADTKGWRDLTPVYNFMLDDYLLFVRATSPYPNAAELVKQAKAKPPRSVSVGSAGTADDMAIAVFQAAASVQLNIVRFNSGGEALTALLGGHVDLAAGNPLEFMGQLQSKAARALGVFRPTRFEAMPDVPTMKEQGIDVVPFQMWRGVALPAGAPADAVAYWQDAMKKVAESKAFKDYITTNVAALHPLPAADFTKFLEAQEALYKNMLASLGQK
ncbi:MAG: tripartite tricarboxylate transporter substrate binding protein [Alphaproteobacteria bacterium]|nr:tripartite tricarboxylate transporter substrate binding protein [Alphaproteobacteria bacterium]